MPPLPHPKVIADLHGDYPHYTHSELISMWQNAIHDGAWGNLPAEVLENEPAEITAARTLWVRSRIDRNRERRAQAAYCCALLIASHCVYE